MNIYGMLSAFLDILQRFEEIGTVFGNRYFLVVEKNDFCSPNPTEKDYVQIHHRRTIYSKRFELYPVMLRVVPTLLLSASAFFAA